MERLGGKARKGSASKKMHCTQTVLEGILPRNGACSHLLKVERAPCNNRRGNGIQSNISQFGVGWGNTKIIYISSRVCYV